jgi:hypothetical protein
MNRYYRRIPPVGTKFMPLDGSAYPTTGSLSKSAGKSILCIAFVCDVDPLIGHSKITDANKEEIWVETIGTVTRLKEQLDRYSDSSLDPIKITWFLRSDWEMFHTCGDWCYPAREFHSDWRTFERSGDEIGWHPHLSRLNRETGAWYQEIGDNSWISCCLKRGYEEISHLFRIRSCRTGWSFHSNHTMRQISQLQISFDVSAIPGQYHNKGNMNLYNWIGSPKHPYNPSSSDYRREAGRSDRLGILEIPVSVYPVPFPLSHLTGKRERGCNLSSLPLFFSLAIQGVFKDPSPKKAMIIHFHPIDVIHKRGLKSSENCVKNLKTLFAAAGSKGTEVQFMTVEEFGRYWITREL